jgi:DNA repair exonuclease SbcCD ATPase subunit
LEAELKATRQLLQAKDQENSRLDQGMKERDQQTAEMVNEIERLKARPATIREIVREIPQYIPFEKPPEVAPPNPATPEAPPQIQLDESQTQDLRKFYLDCHRATLELQACQENAKDWKAKEVTWEEKEAILIQQREAAIRAVKGGTFWTRFKRNGGWYAAGGLTVGGIVAILKR